MTIIRIIVSIVRSLAQLAGLHAERKLKEVNIAVAKRNIEAQQRGLHVVRDAAFPWSK